MLQKIFIIKKRILTFIMLIFQKHFIKFIYCINKSTKDSSLQEEKIFIFDNFEVLRNTLFRALYLSIFKKKLNVKLLFINYKFNPIFKLIYKALGAKQLEIKLNRIQKDECKKYLDLFYKNIESKNDILNYVIDGTNIGLDIYESYLITFNKPTIHKISISNKELFKT